MGEFLILFRGQDGRSLKDTPEEYHAHLDRLSQWIVQLCDMGHLIAPEPLGPGVAVLRRGSKVMTESPFLMAKEMVGGYMRFRAESQEAALSGQKPARFSNLRMVS